MQTTHQNWDVGDVAGPYTLEYRLDGNWEFPGEPSACVFHAESDAISAAEQLRERCPEYTDCAMRVVGSDGTVTATWDAESGEV